MYVKVFIIIIVIGLGIIFSIWDKTGELPPLPIIPDASFETTTGETVALHDFKGKIIFLNFWATWCLPCVAEFPDLLELAQEHKDKMVFIALSVDEDRQKVEPFFDQFDPDVRNILQLENVIIGYDTDKKISYDLFQTTKFPETFIIGPDLVINRKIVGLTDWKSPEIRTLIEPQ